MWLDRVLNPGPLALESEVLLTVQRARVQMLSLLQEKKTDRYSISSVIRQIIFLPKQSQRSRSILKGESKSLGLFRKGKIGIIAKFHKTDLLI